MKNLLSIVFALFLFSFLSSCDKEEPMPEPIASFSVSSSSIMAGETATFTNNSEHADSYSWDFGDGTSSEQENPTHSYSGSGSYSVVLTAKGKGGENSTSKTITVSSPPPIAGFTPDKTSAEIGENITFTNTSEYAQAYSWDFGDGQMSTDENPVHAYEAEGSYTVSLKASGPGGEHTASETIHITYPAPLAGFSMDKNTAATGELITFENTSENASSYAWDFGDGQSSSEENPTHSYSNAGNYTITLTASGEGGTHSVTKTIEITPPPYNIIPGTSIGEFILGDNMGVHKSKIDENWVQHAMILMNNGKYLHLLKYNETGIGFFLETSSASLKDSDVPDAMYAFEPFEGNTIGDITFGSLLTEVVEVFGEPEDISSTGNYSYGSQGISFWTDDTETKVDEIYIHAPDLKKGARPSRSKYEKELHLR